ncbi:hypothetical protein PMAYCL1PPCAC_33496, partial [Pristionchus mayeri]
NDMRFAIISFLLITGTSSLRCFDNSNGALEIVDDPSLRFCQLFPHGGEKGEGRVNGIGAANESLEKYTSLFQTYPHYQLRVMCLLESHNIS